MSHVSTIDQEGAVKIPEEILHEMGLKPGSKVNWVLLKGKLQVYPADAVAQVAGGLKNLTSVKFNSLEEEKAAIENAKEEYYSRKFRRYE